MWKVYCLKSGLKIVYIGYTKRHLHARWRHHKNVHWSRKFMSIELIKECDTKQEAKDLEIQLIQKHNTLVPNGLNKALGHINNDGSKLKIDGIETRFGMREQYPGEEAKRKQRAAIGTSKRCSKPVQCIETGKIYGSLRKCAKDIGVTDGMICMVLKGLRSHAKGFTFKYITIVPK
jgi:predicted GIY-YIG superfamily endonuclease